MDARRNDQSISQLLDFLREQAKAERAKKTNLPARPATPIMGNAGKMARPPLPNLAPRRESMADRADNDEDQMDDDSRLEDGGEEEGPPLKSYTQPQADDDEEDVLASPNQERQKMREKEAGMRQTAASLIPERKKDAARPPETPSSGGTKPSAPETRMQRMPTAASSAEEQKKDQDEKEEAEERARKKQRPKTTFAQLSQRFLSDLAGWPTSLLWMGMRFFRGLLKPKPSPIPKMPGIDALTGVAHDPIERGWISGCYCLTCLSCVLPVIGAFAVLLSLFS